MVPSYCCISPLLSTPSLRLSHFNHAPHWKASAETALNCTPDGALSLLPWQLDTLFLRGNPRHSTWHAIPTRESKTFFTDNFLFLFIFFFFCPPVVLGVLWRFPLLYEELQKQMVLQCVGLTKHFCSVNFHCFIYSLDGIEFVIVILNEIISLHTVLLCFIDVVFSMFRY